MAGLHVSELKRCRNVPIIPRLPLLPRKGGHQPISTHTDFMHEEQQQFLLFFFSPPLNLHSFSSRKHRKAMKQSQCTQIFPGCCRIGLKFCKYLCVYRHSRELNRLKECKVSYLPTVTGIFEVWPLLSCERAKLFSYFNLPFGPYP